MDQPWDDWVGGQNEGADVEVTIDSTNMTSFPSTATVVSGSQESKEEIQDHYSGLICVFQRGHWAKLDVFLVFAERRFQRWDIYRSVTVPDHEPHEDRNHTSPLLTLGTEALSTQQAESQQQVMLHSDGNDSYHAPL
ncbi:Serine/Threonine-Protein Kinase Ulk4 [Manis pentadactyla]|nr:Serine/Threonine-Protein Kinase Ulk4 [Manis pentadactyla]